MPIDFSQFASAQDLHAIMPMIVLTVAGIVVLLADLVKLPLRSGVLATIAFAGIAAAVVLTFQMGFTGRQPAYSGMLVVDGVAVFLSLVVLVGTGLAVLLSASYLPATTSYLGEYYALVLFAAIGMLIMVMSEDLMAIFLGLEILSMALYVLAGFFRTARRSTEAALKYFLLGAFASGFLLFGIGLLYGATGTTQVPMMQYVLQMYGQYVSPYLLLGGLGLILIGMGFKAGVVPFHMWVPDVYEGAPSAVTAFMSAAPKAAALAVVLRIFAGELNMLARNWVDVFLVLGVLTMTLGNLVAVAQDNMKRMLAYSGIAHIGYLFAGIAAFNGNSASAVLYYLAVYSFMNMGAFAVLAMLNRRGRYEFLDDYAGLSSRQPVIALAMTVFLVSLAGLPPTAGFLSKLYLFKALIESNQVPTAVLAMLNSVVSVYYYLRVVVYMYMKEPVSEVQTPGMALGAGLAVAISLVMVLVLGVHPGSVVEWARMAVGMP